MLEGIVIKNSLDAPWTATSSSSSSSSRRWRSTSPTASTTPRTSSRRRSRRARCRRASRSRSRRVLNFVGAFISLEVAATVAKGIVDADAITTTIVFAGLIGAIAWNLATWYFGLPSSSSHALIGGVVGAAFVADGHERDPRRRPGREGHRPGADRAGARLRGRRASRSSSPTASSGALRPGPVNRGFRLGQLVSGGAARARARHQRRAEDDGHHHARADRQRQHLGATTSTSRPGSSSRSATAIALGTYIGRLADHPHDGHAHHQDGPGAGLRRAGRGRRGRSSPRRTSAIPLSTTHVISGGDHGRRRGQAAVGRALGRGRQHRARLGADAAVRGRSSAALAYGVTRDLRRRARSAPLVVSLLDHRPGRRDLRRARARAARPSRPAEA